MRRISGIEKMIDAKRAEITATEALLQGQRIELEQLERMRRRMNEGASPQATVHRRATAERAHSHFDGFALDQGRACEVPLD